MKDVLLSEPNCTHIVTLFTFIFRFSTLNVTIHMNYSDYTDIFLHFQMTTLQFWNKEKMIQAEHSLCI